ncbi:GyrI-like domain-containing protein [Cohnella lupini]|uniref:GyrI-like small molecule binding protein n=1 Tax=Cohnella lupini TaxID=1294267 RepID=A0A3D9I134_9BACL|nr:GyrI-like domain-containing protein [Cohnella lupini]RED55477.1 GyrI-like small molecule binding protein [Cohnella lupini]
MEAMMIWQERVAIDGVKKRLRVRDGQTTVDPHVAEAGTYAVFKHEDPSEAFESFIKRIYEEWFTKTMYVPGPYYVEARGEKGPDEQSADEVWIPVDYTKPAHCGSYQNSWTTIAQALREAIKFTPKKELSLVDVMGYTGHAFRININGNNVDPAGPTAWDWGPVLEKDLLRLGIRCSYVGEPNYTPPTPELLGQAIEKVQSSLDRGIPAVAWDLLIPEFGVIYGYDDDKQELHVKDVSGEGVLPYAKLGRGQVGELFVLTFDGFFETDKRTVLVETLESIVEHARVRYHLHSEPPFQNGLDAYDAWIEAFRKGTVDPFGNAYNVAVVCDSRAYAVRFLQELQQRWDGDSREEQEVSRLAALAENHYRDVFNALVRLPSLYPFPQGGNPNVEANAAYSIDYLERAREAERQGVETLESMLKLLKSHP